MTSDRTQLVNELHDSMQEIKRWYLQNTDRLSSTNQGLGAGQNSTTTKILERYGIYRPFCSCCDDLAACATDANLSLRDRYSLVREMLVVHPTLHELWFFDGHYNHVTGNRDVGPRVRRVSMVHHRWGLGSYLTRRNGTSDKDRSREYSACAAKALEFTALLENLYAGHLDRSLFDVKPLADDELPSAIAFLQAHPEPRYADVLALMPKVFEVTRTLLHQVGDDPAIAGSVIGKIGDVNWAMCAINEGPIFDRRSERSGLDVLRRLDTLDECAIRRTLREHYDVVTDGYELVNRDCVRESDSPSPVLAPTARAASLRIARDPASSPGKITHWPPGATPMERTLFMERLSETSPILADVGSRLLEWSDRNGLWTQWGGNVTRTVIPYLKHGSETYQFVHVWSDGTFRIDLKRIKMYPQFAEDDARAELIERLRKISGLGFTRSVFETKKRPEYSMDILVDQTGYDQFINLLEWYFETIRKNPAHSMSKP